MAWTLEREDELRKLWPKHSAGVIARILGGGLTRNAVIGKASRLGLGGHRSPIAVKRHAEKLVRAANVSTAIHRIRKRILNEADITPVRIVFQNSADDFNIPVEQRKSIIQLTSRTCHWPVGDPRAGNFFYCGGDTVLDSPYCASHKRRLHVQAQEGSTPSASGVVHRPMLATRKAGMR